MPPNNKQFIYIDDTSSNASTAPVTPPDYQPLEFKTLRNLPLGTWVKYINPADGKLRGGGLIIQNRFPDFIELFNRYNGFRWALSLKEYKEFFATANTVQMMQKEDIKNQLYDAWSSEEAKRSKRRGKLPKP